MNKIILVFLLVYNVVVIGLFMGAQKDPSSSLGVAFTILSVWIIGLIAQLLLVRFKVIVIKTWIDKLAIVFSSPIPYIIYLFFYL